MSYKHLLLVFILTIFGSFKASSISKPFELNGIFYEVIDEASLTVCVTSPGSNYSYYTGIINIPATISYEGKTYTITRIEHDAFRGQSKLTSVILPKSVQTIGYKAFSGAVNLTNIVFNSAGELSEIEYQAFKNCNHITSLKFPASLKSIGDNAFEDCSALKSINLSSVKVLNKAVFKGCDNLLEVNIPQSVTTLGEMCFWGCSVLRRVSIDGLSLEYIGPDAFLDCHQLEEINIPNSVKKIDYEAFRGCWNLSSIELPNSVTEIGYGIFRYCVSLKNIKLSESLKEIPSWAFVQSDLESITIPNSVRNIGVSAFEECNKLKEIHFGNGLEKIWANAFLCCQSLESVILPEPLLEIGMSAFQGCKNLQFVSIPRTVTTIYNLAFSECPKLANVNDLATVPQPIFGCNIFNISGPDGPVKVHVYEGLYEIYSTTMGWYDIPNSFSSNIIILDDIPIVAIESIKFLESPIFCNVGEQKKASIKLLPENATSTEMIWSSSDDSVLYVDMFSGEFIGLAKGEANLTVSVKGGGDISASVKVIVGDDAGIESIISDATDKVIIYDIFGRRLKELQKGLNIVNGKKIHVK